MTPPSKNTPSVSDAKDHIEYSMTPKEISSSKPAGADHEVAIAVAAATGTTGEAGAAAAAALINANNERNEHVVLKVRELLRSLGDVEKLEISVVGRLPQQEMITSNHNTSELINQIALQFCAQFGAVFMGFALNKSLSSCSCAVSVSASAKWIAITVTFTCLTGFVLSLIAVAMSLEENKNSTPPGGPGPISPSKRRSIFPVAAKFGFAALASTVIISIGATLPLNTISMVAVTAGAIFLPFLIAFLNVLDHLKLLFHSCLNGFDKYFR